VELLQQREDRGYPVEYLLSRIRGRRSRLITDWRGLAFDISPFDHLASGKYGGILKDKAPEGIWRNLVKEYRWAYVQMNGRLREIFSPFFLYSELKTLFICLRHVNDKKAGRVDELLSVSLLSNAVQDVLLTSVDVPFAIAGIERNFTAYSVQFAGLSEVFESDGLRGVEQRLTNTYLTEMTRKRIHPLMKMFFMRLIDSRNIMGIYKFLKLDSKALPSFIEGGTVPGERHKEIVDQKDLLGLKSLVREVTGSIVETIDPMQAEIALYKGMTRFLKKAGQDPLGAELILDYLWRCSIEAMNLSIVFYSRDLERDAVTAELVQ
jgi:vacuolar-type H+-ATPase subunit C/Vma6